MVVIVRSSINIQKEGKSIHEDCSNGLSYNRDKRRVIYYWLLQTNFFQVLVLTRCIVFAFIGHYLVQTAARTIENISQLIFDHLKSSRLLIISSNL